MSAQTPWYVTAYRLTDADPIVHDAPDSWVPVVTHTYPDGSPRRQVVRTRCGGQLLDYAWREQSGVYISGGNPGTMMLTRHAVAMGARFCRRCWPDGFES